MTSVAVLVASTTVVAGLAGLAGVECSVNVVHVPQLMQALVKPRVSWQTTAQTATGTSYVLQAKSKCLCFVWHEELASYRMCITKCLPGHTELVCARVVADSVSTTSWFTREANLSNMLEHMESTAKQQAAQRLYIPVCWHDERSAAEEHGFTAYDKQFVTTMHKSLMCQGAEA